MKAVILAGGLGKRIASVRSDVPKPMIEISGKPVLLHQIENLRDDGITDITLVTGHLGHVVENFFGDGSAFGVNISYFREGNALGTAGALLKMESLTEDFLLILGDTLFSLDFSRFISFHNSTDSWATLMAHPNNHPFDSSLIETENKKGSKKITRWISKEEERGNFHNMANTGVAIISPKLISYIKENFPELENIPQSDLDLDLLKPAVPTGKLFFFPYQ